MNNKNAFCIASLFLFTATSSTASALDHAISLYGWGTDISGDIRLGKREAAFDADFDDLFNDVIRENLEAAITLHYEAKGDAWGGGLDVMYIDLEQKRGRFDTSVETAIVDLFALYAINDNVDVIGGVRILSVDVEVDTQTANLADTNSESVNGFAGFRVHVPVSDKWTLNGRLDAGGGDADFTWNALAGARWQFSDRAALDIGYRAVGFEFDDEERRIRTELDLQFDGPFVALTFNF